MMFSLKVILILCFGLTITCFSPTSGDEATPIKKTTEAVKTFFQKVKNLDSNLRSPQAMNNFGTINYSIGTGRRTKIIVCSKEFLTEFRTEYAKLATISKNVATDYINQINSLFPRGSSVLLGNEKGRNSFCNYYSNEFLLNVIIGGDASADKEILASLNKLREGPKELYSKICGKPLAPGQTSPTLLYERQQSTSSRRSSGSGAGRGLMFCLCLGPCLE